MKVIAIIYYYVISFIFLSTSLLSCSCTFKIQDSNLGWAGLCYLVGMVFFVYGIYNIIEGIKSQFKR